MAQSKPKNQEQTRAQAGLRASLLGLLLNALLAATKMVAGSVSGSVSIFADGINNLSDTGSVLVSLLSLRMARKPEDRDHPFGHGRIEYIGTLAIAVIILYVGIDLLKRSIAAIAAPEAPYFTWLLFGATALSLPVKAFMWWYNREKGRAHNLVTLLAASQDSRNDVLVTSARTPALARLGLEPSRFAGLTWVAVTAHGFTGPGAARVGFGDDCAAAGGLLDRVGDEPRFAGDALADPLTGLEAALAVLAGQRGLIDMAMARVAASYAA